MCLELLSTYVKSLKLSCTKTNSQNGPNDTRNKLRTEPHLLEFFKKPSCVGQT